MDVALSPFLVMLTDCVRFAFLTSSLGKTNDWTTKVDIINFKKVQWVLRFSKVCDLRISTQNQPHIIHRDLLSLCHSCYCVYTKQNFKTVLNPDEDLRSMLYF